MQIVGVSNIKGGVGKTTTAVNLAFLAASTGRRTVLWDLDPQGAATYLLDGEANQRVSARKLVRGRRGLQEILAPTRFENLALLPADTSYRNFDIARAVAGFRRGRRLVGPGPPAVLLHGGPAQVAAPAGHRRGAEPVPVDALG